MAGALLRYRIMAYIVGVGLVVLVFVGVPLQVWGGNDSVARVVGIAHGYLYIVYLLMALDLMRRTRLGLKWLLAMVAAGLLPGLAFVVEHYVTRRVRGLMAVSSPA
jgi:integral membrane protein